MNARAKKLVAEAMELSVEERAEVVHELLATLEGDDDEGVQAAWAEESERRARDALAVRGESHDLREVLDRLEAELRSRTTP